MLWRGFQKPKRLAVEQDTLTDKFGKFSAQPFERGFGTTIGNALRRTLLSLHRRRSRHRRPHRRRPARVPVHHRRRRRCHRHYPEPQADPLQAERRRPQGPLPPRRRSRRRHLRIHRSRWRRRDPRQGRLHLHHLRRRQDRHGDASQAWSRLHLRRQELRRRPRPRLHPRRLRHSPVRKVNYIVEAARLGQITDYDKLSVEIWTNGTILPPTPSASPPSSSKIT